MRPAAKKVEQHFRFAVIVKILDAKAFRHHAAKALRLQDLVEALYASSINLEDWILSAKRASFVAVVRLHLARTL